MTDPQHEETFADTERKLREIITTLRAQLAEAHKDGFQLAAWQCLFDDGKTGIVCDDWGNQYCAMQRRADRAEQRVATLEHEVRLREAALAAQIEADARIADECERQNGPLSKRGSDPYVQGLSSAGQAIAAAIRAQPHDRTALDRYREKALREAADELRGQGYGNAVRTILARIEKE